MDKALSIYCDGGCHLRKSDGNYEGYCGIYVELYEKSVTSYYNSMSFYLGKDTNNEAEYAAFINAVKYAIDMCDSGMWFDAIFIFCDSEIVVQQVNGIYDAIPRMAILRDLANNLLEILRSKVKVVITHISGEENKAHCKDWIKLCKGR